MTKKGKTKVLIILICISLSVGIVGASYAIFEKVNNNLLDVDRLDDFTNNSNHYNNILDGNKTKIIKHPNIFHTRIYITADSEQEITVAKAVYEVIVGVPYCNCTGVTELYIDGFLHSLGNHTHIEGFDYESFLHIVDFSNFPFDYSTLLALGKHGEYINAINVTIES